MARFKVVIAESRYTSHEQEQAVLEGIDAEVILERSDDEDKIAALMADADGLIVNLAPITAKVIAAMRNCKCISRYGVGVDNVDVDAASEKKIAVLHVRNYCNEDVSDHALALIMSCVRRTAFLDRRVRKGEWNIAKTPIHRLQGKVLGLVGYGGIARALRRKVSGFGLETVLVYDPYISAEDIGKEGGKKVELDELLRKSDFISVHAPLTDDTRGILGSAQFEIMKPTAILVNTSRGPLIDSDALYEALKNGKIHSAGVDVFDPEPPNADCKLFELENITLTDHVGWYSEESQSELQRSTAQNVALCLTGKPPLYCVNSDAL